MPSEPSVHDNHLVGYSVLAEGRQIVLQTRNPYRAHELVDVVFEGVLAYYLEHDLIEGILFDVCEVDIRALVKKEASRFEEGERWGWPRGWQKKKESIEAYVARLGLHAFEIDSSYGMSGCVLAAKVSRIQKAANKAPEPTPTSVMPRANESRIE